MENKNLGNEKNIKKLRPKSLKQRYIKKAKDNVPEIILGLVVGVLYLVWLMNTPIRYIDYDRGEYGTRMLSRLEIIKENPDKIYDYVLLIILFIPIALVVVFLKDAFKRDWFKT